MQTFSSPVKKDILSNEFDNIQIELISISYMRQEKKDTSKNDILTHFKLLVMMSGTACVHLQGNRYYLKPEDSVLIPPGTLYNAQFCGEKEGEFFAVNFHLADQSQMQAFQKLMHHKAIIITPNLVPQRTFAMVMRNLSNIQSQQPGAYFNTLLMVRKLLFLIVYQNYYTNPAQPTADTTSSAAEKLVVHCTGYIIQNSRKNIEVKELCEVFNVSQSYLYKCFKEVLNCSTKDYILQNKLKQTEMALMQTDKTITEIALEYGFSNCYQYSNTFKKFYGVSPSKFRKTVRI